MIDGVWKKKKAASSAAFLVRTSYDLAVLAAALPATLLEVGFLTTLPTRGPAALLAAALPATLTALTTALTTLTALLLTVSLPRIAGVRASHNTSNA